MLSFIKAPEEVFRAQDQQGRTLLTKEALLAGHIESIDAVIGRRLADKRCMQAPRKKPSCGYCRYIVSVHYTLADDGFVLLELVKVSFNQGKTWSCFFDSRYGDMGRENPDSYLSYYYIDERDLQTALLKYEESLIIRQLVKKGPDSFPMFDDFDEAQISSELLALLAEIEFDEAE